MFSGLCFCVFLGVLLQDKFKHQIRIYKKGLKVLFHNGYKEPL